MAHFPFFIDISGREILIVGGGNVALRKAEKLIGFGALITVIAPVICEELERLGGVKLIRREFEDGDIYGKFAVIAAADDHLLNGHIFRLCSERVILVNTVDDPENCGFFFPALVHRGNVTVGISTGGTAPAFAKSLREKAESLLDERTLMIGEFLARARPLIKEMFPTEELRAGAAAELLRRAENGEIADEDNIRECLERIKKSYENSHRDT